MNHYRKRIDGQIVNLQVGSMIRIPTDFAPPRSWFYKLAKKWSARIPGFAVRTSKIRGSGWIFVERVK